MSKEDVLAWRAEFRMALGKLGRVAESRPDLCWLCSMLARGQAQPLADPSCDRKGAFWVL